MLTSFPTCADSRWSKLRPRLTPNYHKGAMSTLPCGRNTTVHLVDATLFYSPTSGGVKRYLSAKHGWLAAHTSWEHTIVVPGRETHIERGGVCTLSGHPVPGTFNYRLPLNPRRWTRLLEALEPTLI